MAERCAHLMGGNGLSTEQSVEIMAKELGAWKDGKRPPSHLVEQLLYELEAAAQILDMWEVQKGCREICWSPSKKIREAIGFIRNDDRYDRLVGVLRGNIRWNDRAHSYEWFIPGEPGYIGQSIEDAIRKINAT